MAKRKVIIQWDDMAIALLRTLSLPNRLLDKSFNVPNGYFLPWIHPIIAQDVPTISSDEPLWIGTQGNKYMRWGEEDKWCFA